MTNSLEDRTVLFAPSFPHSSHLRAACPSPRFLFPETALPTPPPLPLFWHPMSSLHKEAVRILLEAPPGLRAQLVGGGPASLYAPVLVQQFTRRGRAGSLLYLNLLQQKEKGSGRRGGVPQVVFKTPPKWPFQKKPVFFCRRVYFIVLPPTTGGRGTAVQQDTNERS